MAGNLPTLAEQLILLDLKEFRIGVCPARQAAPFVVVKLRPGVRCHVHDHLIFYIECPFNIADLLSIAKGRQSGRWVSLKVRLWPGHRLLANLPKVAILRTLFAQILQLRPRLGLAPA
jgi:hypothetical protein